MFIDKCTSIQRQRIINLYYIIKIKLNLSRSAGQIQAFPSIKVKFACRQWKVDVALQAEK